MNKAWVFELAKTQMGLSICQVFSESLLYTKWVAKSLSFLHAYIEDFDQHIPQADLSLRWLVLLVL